MPPRSLFYAYGAHSLWILPDGSGRPLSQAQTFGGAVSDVTVTMWLYDSQDDPTTLIEPMDVGLVANGGNLRFCGDRVAPTGWDQPNARFYFAGAPAGGGCRRPGEAAAFDGWVCGLIIPDFGHTLAINSPDIDGDLKVDTSDLILFAHDYFEGYDYRSDFHWDGQIDLSDLVIFAGGYGSSCQP